MRKSRFYHPVKLVHGDTEVRRGFLGIEYGLPAQKLVLQVAQADKYLGDSFFIVEPPILLLVNLHWDD